MLSHKLKVTNEGVISGNGLVATDSIEQGELIWQPSGFIVTKEQRDKIYQKLGYGLFFSQIGKDLFAQNTKQEWMMNHSCSPNTALRKGKIVALRTIHIGSEITYDYGLTELYPPWKIRCRCGYLYCREVISSEDYKDARLVQECGIHLEEYVQQAVSKVKRIDSYLFQINKAIWRWRYRKESGNN